MAGLASPIVIIAVLIVISIVVLIGAAVLGIDRGVLASMGRRSYARGLITYLFAVVTIGTAAIVGLFALLPIEKPDIQKEQFTQAKEVLSLLLGVFGTIVGYYFGSESSRGEEAKTLRTSPNSLHYNPADKTLLFETHVIGGTRPIRYTILLDDERVADKQTLAEDGNIRIRAKLTPKSPDFTVLSLDLTDNAGGVMHQQFVCRLT